MTGAHPVGESPKTPGDGLTQLLAFFQHTRSFSARFQSTAAGEKQSGTLIVERPNRFDWRYEKPYAQRLVADGRRLWIYDPDLKQVTVRTLGRVLNSTPAALLAGSTDLERLYRLTPLARPSDPAGAWVEAIPKQRDDTGFQRVRLRFVDELPTEMQVEDSFGQTSTFRFNQLVPNPSITPQQFLFAPPPGTEVVQLE